MVIIDDDDGGGGGNSDHHSHVQFSVPSVTEGEESLSSLLSSPLWVELSDSGPGSLGLQSGAGKRSRAAVTHTVITC